MACLKASEEVGDHRGISGSSRNIGRIYSHRKQFQKALPYYEKSLRFKDGNKSGMADEIDLIGSTHADLKHDSLALRFFKQALEIRTSIGDLQGVGMSHNNLAQFYLNEKDVNLSVDHVQQSINAYEKANDRLGIGLSRVNLSKALQIKKQYAKAAEVAEVSLSIGKELGDVQLIKESANTLSASYKALGRNDQALSMYEHYITMRDSIDSENNQREVLNQEYKYQYEKQALTDSLIFAKKEAVLEERTEKQQIGLIAGGECSCY